MSINGNLAEKEVVGTFSPAIHSNEDDFKAKCTDIFKYERRHSDMSKKNRSESSISTATKESEVESAFTKFLRKHPVIAFFAPSILPLLLQLMWLCAFNLFQLPAEIKLINEKLDTLSTKVSDLSSTVNSLQTDMKDLGIDVARLDARVDGIDKRCDDLYTFLNYGEGLTPTTITKNAISTGIGNNDTQEVFVPVYLSAPTWEPTDVLAIDSAGAELTAADLVNKKMLLPYESNGQEVYFYGQYNANNHWDGNCIINVYKDDSLILITDVLYNDGEVVSYKQVMSTKTQHKDPVWAVSDRINNGDCNTGDTWNYYAEDSISKSFNIDTVSVKDVLSVEYFKSTLNEAQLEALYHGSTSNGLYNDVTGTAYLIKYDTNGEVRTLYSGNFVDGKFHDDTGNAWYITRDDISDTDYMYYRGTFSYGSPDKNSKYEFKSNLTNSDIDLYIEGKQFGSELKWAKTDSMKNS